MIDLRQITEHVIDPALKAVDLYSPEASQLLLLTGFVESRYKYVAQLGSGPARSFWQVEPNTVRDHYKHYLEPFTERTWKVNGLRAHGDYSIEDELSLNMGFAVVMARLVYRRKPTPIPALGDIEAQAYIWKKDYNTLEGSGSEEKFIELANEIKDLI